MKRLFFYLVILFAAVWFGLKIQADPGYALFSYQGWQIIMPLWFAAVILIISFFLCYLLVRFIKRTSRLGERFRAWSQLRRLRRSHRRTSQGLIEFSEGNWTAAERYLMAAVTRSNTPLINYLGAARAAQELGAYERRDEYLRKAHLTTTGSEMAVGLTQAQLQLTHGQLEQSLATLKHLQSLDPQHTYVLKLLQKTYLKLQDWEGLLALIPTLRKHKLLDNEELNKLTISCYSKLLKGVAEHQKDEADQIWQQIPRALQKDSSLVNCYANNLIKNNKIAKVAELLEENLKRQWDASLIRIYGLIKTDNLVAQLKVAENFLKDHQNNPDLLLCLGRLSFHNKLWGQAKEYLITSTKLVANPEAFFELGCVLEQLGEESEAIKYFKKGMNP